MFYPIVMIVGIIITISLSALGGNEIIEMTKSESDLLAVCSFIFIVGYIISSQINELEKRIK